MSTATGARAVQPSTGRAGAHPSARAEGRAPSATSGVPHLGDAAGGRPRRRRSHRTESSQRLIENPEIPQNPPKTSRAARSILALTTLTASRREPHLTHRIVVLSYGET